VEVPTSEEAPRAPFGDYGVRKAAMEAALLDFARRRGFPATVLHPGHIVGRGWVPLNPAGNFNPEVFAAIARGQTLTLPNLGLETVHHVHADDVAQGFVRALGARQASAGESFHLVSPAALTLRGFAERMFAWFGRRPALAYLPWEQWRGTVSEEDARSTWDHIAHSPCCSIRKAQRVLGYQPRYTSLEAVTESVQWLQDNNDPLMRRSSAWWPRAACAICSGAEAAIATGRIGDVRARHPGQHGRHGFRHRRGGVQHGHRHEDLRLPGGLHGQGR
jgi:nucleoside-diphosphate-sugar epimerase